MEASTTITSQTEPTEIVELTELTGKGIARVKTVQHDVYDDIDLENMVNEEVIAYEIADNSNSNDIDITTTRAFDESTALMYASETNADSIPDGGRQANLVLLGSFMGLIADFGIANSMGAIESYISTHQLIHDKNVNVSWIFSLHLGVMYFGGVFFGELFDRFGAKRPLMVGTVFLCVGLFTTAESRTLYQFVLSFSVLTALGTSICMSPLIGVLSHWYLRKRAMACSIATIGGLVGGSCFSILLQQLYTKVGYKWAIRVLAFICLFCMSIAILLVRERPKEKKQRTEEGDGHSQTSSMQFTQGNILKMGIKFLKGALDFSILKDSRFVLLTLAVWLAELISMSSLTYLSSYALNFGLSNSNAYLLITVVNLCGIPSRLVSGILADKYGRFNVMIGTSVLTTIVIFGLWLPAKGSTGLLFAFGALFGISTSAVISLIPACTGQICSSNNFGKVYGTLYFFLAFLTILGMYLASVVISHGSVTNYRNFVLYEGALAVSSGIIWILARYSAVGWKLAKF